MAQQISSRHYHSCVWQILFPKRTFSEQQDSAACCFLWILNVLCTSLHIRACGCVFRKPSSSLCRPAPWGFCALTLRMLCLWTSLVAQTVKRLSTMRETWVQALGWEDPLEKEMAIHSSTIAWKIPWTEEPGRLQSRGSQRVRHDWATSLHLFVFIQHISAIPFQFWKTFCWHFYRVPFFERKVLGENHRHFYRSPFP